MHVLKTLTILLVCLMATATTADAQRRKARTKAKPVVKQEDPAEARMREKLTYTEKILVFDSVVVARDSMAKAVSLPRHLGRIATFSQMFDKEASQDWMAYINEFGDRCLLSMADTAGHMRLYSADKIGREWTTPKRITDFDSMFDDITCPYLSEDGSTLHFAARGSETLGGYDVYRTYYDTETRQFVTPESMGLPYNSTADDLYCIISDIDTLGWLVTSRGQQDGNVCVYSFVRHTPRLTYADDGLTEEQLLPLAEIRQISDTWDAWPDKSARRNALKRKAGIGNDTRQTASPEDILVVNDRLTYTSASQIRSSEARSLYTKLVQTRKAAMALTSKTEMLRTAYHNADRSRRAQLAPEITANERQITAMQQSIAAMEKEIRGIENR